MDGHKWECFLLDLSFIGWDLLGIGTMGLSNIFYTIPFRMTAFAEYFVYVRGLAKKAQIEGIHELDDIYLYELASVDDLEWFYQDIVEDEKYLAAVPKDALVFTMEEHMLSGGFGETALPDCRKR